MFSLDANVLFYAADKTAGDRHVAARQIVEGAAEANAALSDQVLFEFYHSSTRKGQIPAAEAATIIGDLAQNFTVIFGSHTIVADVVGLLAKHRLSVWNARVLAVCAANKCHTLLSEDMQDGAIYNEVRVINPFRPNNSAIVGNLLSS